MAILRRNAPCRAMHLLHELVEVAEPSLPFLAGDRVVGHPAASVLWTKDTGVKIGSVNRKKKANGDLPMACCAIGRLSSGSEGFPAVLMPSAHFFSIASAVTFVTLHTRIAIRAQKDTVHPFGARESFSAFSARKERTEGHRASEIRSRFGSRAEGTACGGACTGACHVCVHLHPHAWVEAGIPACEIVLEVNDLSAGGRPQKADDGGADDELH